MSASAGNCRAEAQALASRGDLEGALRVMEKGVAEHPDNAPLANSAGNLAMKAGDAGSAARHFGQAAALEPASLEYAINHAIALAALERHRDALAALAPMEQEGTQDARYCSVRANSARSAGNLAEAASWYDRSIMLNPAGARAQHGRARVALERGESDAVQRFERAVATNRSDPQAWLGLAEALEGAGEKDRARDIAQQLADHAPQWIDALRLLAQIRVGAGEEDFASHLTDAEAKVPRDPAIAREHIKVLEQHDLFTEAMEVAERAAARFPEDESFTLLQATNAGIIGEDALADRLFASLSLDTPNRWLLQARYVLHRGEFDACEAMLDKVIAAEPWHINAWAVRDLLWRRSGDSRGDWLHGQQGLVQMVELPDRETVLGAAVPFLHQLHDRAAFPLGQSLRGGTQTRGNLFERTEPEITALHDAIARALEIYRQGLPAKDETHPLLRHRDTPWTFADSWSVRLDAGGHYHAAHIHPHGILSSALYCQLPPDLGEDDGRNGWIELGRPPPNMRLDLDPLYELRPREGHLALFPSTLYHGTRPFDAGRRMTVAFDVVLDKQ